MLVGTLVVLLFTALLQLAVALHVRNVLIDSAAEGARFGALDGNGTAEAESRARDLIVSALNERFAADVAAHHSDVDGVTVLEVNVTAPLPLVWLYGPSNILAVSGRTVDEGEL